SDGNGSHASTLKSPSYTKSVSWQHYRNHRTYTQRVSTYEVTTCIGVCCTLLYKWKNQVIVNSAYLTMLKQ
ncbi:hypothetical protein P2O67_25165, partial [Escherichia coli]